MDSQRIQLLVPGRRIAAEPDADIRHLIKIEPISSNQIQAVGRGEPVQQTLVEGPGDSIVKLEYESGLVEWLRLDQLQAELGPSRGTGPTPMPAVLNRSGGASRGATDWVLKAMHVFEISPVDKIAEGSAGLIVSALESKLDTGLFFLKDDGSFGDRITAELPADTRPYLVFIHGTASSTQGSFSAFWDDPLKKQPTDEWKALQKTYGNRILALEHRTLSVSPALNALDLVRLLPPKATVHAITHSRGGLIGELLGLKSLTEDDLKGFAGRPDRQLFSDLAGEIARKDFNIAKFVRTACPAAGTILASKRIDLYLNVILNAVGLIPGLGENPAFAIFKASALQLIKLRADPALLPGLEAQMPESPVIHLLNTQGRFSDVDLGVIAGDFEGSGVWGTLKEYALRAYYLEDNDFVVNTKSMSGGMERKKGVWRFLDQGSAVNHFSYFKNARTREQMLNWLSGAPAVEKDFQRVRGVEPGGAARGATRGAEEMPVAFLLPDVFGTCLEDTTEKKTKVWPAFDELAKGRFLELAGEGLKPGLLHEQYQTLFEALSLSHDAVPVPYDWRGPLADAATVLEKAVLDKLAGKKREVRFIAHGMGGLVVREFARRDEARWKTLCGETGGLLMLGTPTRGSWQAMRLLAGRSRLVRMIALLGRHRDAEVVSILQGFPGLLDLLPEDMFDLAAWHDVQLGRPPAEKLQAAAEWRKTISGFNLTSGRSLYVAGTAPATPSSMDAYTAEGDGNVTYALGIPPNTRVWYSASDHGGLVSQAAPIIQLLNTGASGSLDVQPHPPVSGLDAKALDLREEMVFFPGEGEFLDAVFGRHHGLQAADEAVIRVKVAHGHLREAAYPLAVGHYAGDGIVSGEADLDRQLGGMLSTRFHMDLYPGPAGTAEVVRAPGAHPPGALIAGLGEVGEITPERVRKSMLDACLRYALMRSEESEGLDELPRSAAFSSTLIGISGGRAISISDSVKSIVHAAVEANRVLRQRNLWDRVRIDEVEFIELYEHSAITAAHAAAALPQNLKNELLPGERIVFEGQMRTLKGGRLRPPENEYATGWWRRIQISQDRCETTARDRTSSRKTASSLVFENLTDRARAEESRVTIQSDLLDSLLAQATKQSCFEESGAVALFELLLPNGLKDQSSEQADLCLVLDQAAAAFPWEILAARTRDRIEPLSVKVGMLRQLKVDTFRMGPRGARDHNALVIGDTLTDAASGFPELPGAQREAQEVAEQLTRHGYLAEPMIRQPSLDIVRQLFARDYRIMHLAGHGVYNQDYPEKSGMVLGEGQFLTSLELGQVRNLPELVFINCCYLASIDSARKLDRPHRMAASVARELIQMGVKAVVAAGWAVNDAAGLVFARSFYQSMLGRLKFGEAVKQARKDTYALGTNNTWGAYQCYGNPDFALTPETGPRSRSTRTPYSRRECLDELRDVAATSTGASADQVAALATRVGELDRVLISTWRDGETLSALAEAYKSLEKFEAALEAFQEALRDGSSLVSVQTIEHFANLQDRHAERIFTKDAEEAAKLWDRAERRLTGLNDVLGNSVERLALLGALYKRRGTRTAEGRAGYFQKAADFYQKAYQHAKATESRIDPWPGLNAVALSYLAGMQSAIAVECLQFVAQQKDYPDFWARVSGADALLLGHLCADDLASHLDEVIKAYREAFPHGTPYERNSALSQLRFLAAMAPPKNGPLLQQVLDGVCMMS